MRGIPKNNNIKKIIFRILIFVVVFYTVALIFLYFFQEKLLFYPQKLPSNYLVNELPNGIEEKYIVVEDNIKLHGLLVKSGQHKGLVFYLHGNGGNDFGWVEKAGSVFSSLGYDTFVPDYRGYGKSGGTINSEKQLFDDNEKAYQAIASEYKGKPIVIAGYSIGSGMAAHLAAGKNIKALILQAPYYSLSSLCDEKIPFYLPDFVKKYPVETFKWIDKINAPKYFFHGTEDFLIPYQNSEQLAKGCTDCEVILLPYQGHNGINTNFIFRDKIKDILR
ncbi:alpha/beta hydrolase [Flavobacterium rhizosphaerae]|uniref:Alpha/beta fold hydrolase n=1 Tax=Flavobacterium rhizosphaerae TaxID=3163298 RepID=A0ABW8YWZ7_9FLAO